MKGSILGREYELYETAPDQDSVLKNTGRYCDRSSSVRVINAM